MNTSDAKPGRKRSEAVRAAILDATLAIASRHGYGSLTIEGIAAEAGVGKQTIYRWWPSLREVVVETLGRHAEERVVERDRGSLHEDLTSFLGATFRSVADRGTSALLRGLVAEAQLDDRFREELGRTFIASRRSVLRGILQRAIGRGELEPTADVELGVDIAYGVMWYRLLLGEPSLDRTAARKIARSVERALSTPTLSGRR